MKIRNGFVSNSSSSSFVIMKYHLSEEQIDKIMNYLDIVEDYIKIYPVPDCGYYKDDTPEYDFSYSDWGWLIKNEEDFIYGQTDMDNFDFCEILRYIKVDSDHEIICWDDSWDDSLTLRQEEFLRIERKKLRKLKLEGLNE